MRSKLKREGGRDCTARGCAHIERAQRSWRNFSAAAFVLRGDARIDCAPDRSPKEGCETPGVGGTATRRDGSRVLKLAPLVSWGRADTWSHLLSRDLPYNALLDRGYTSIGCEPCTAQPAGVEGEGERSGRWTGHAKTECGIHEL